ncbi:hypothetical protein PUN28_007462 [Cardiocondyla obscurior]|uniref:Uncharacterized protein n=1 Tax=Cardiocondyla obscurior TaxID=286306 RepID=A0AAW2G5R0_9HYME
MSRWCIILFIYDIGFTSKNKVKERNADTRERLELLNLGTINVYYFSCRRFCISVFFISRRKRMRKRTRKKREELQKKKTKRWTLRRALFLPHQQHLPGWKRAREVP